MINFKDIPQLTRMSNYQVHVDWRHIDEILERYDDRTLAGSLGLNLDPDSQRAHVWDEEKRRRYIEFVLRGGHSSRDIYFNHPGWNGSFQGEMVLVDGKQRLEAVRMFMKNELAILGGHLYRDFAGHIRFTMAHFVFRVNDLATRREVLQWYIDLNDGGVAHTSQEIAKVRILLEKEPA